MERSVGIFLTHLPHWAVALVGQSVESEVEVEDVYAGFTEKAKLSRGGVLRDETVYCGFCEVALIGDAWSLIVSCGGGDIWVKARARRSDEIDGDRGSVVLRCRRCGTCSLLGCNACLHALDESFAAGA